MEEAVLTWAHQDDKITTYYVPNITYTVPCTWLDLYHFWHRTSKFNVEKFK